MKISSSSEECCLATSQFECCLATDPTSFLPPTTTWKDWGRRVSWTTDLTMDSFVSFRYNWRLEFLVSTLNWLNFQSFSFPSFLLFFFLIARPVAFFGKLARLLYWLGISISCTHGQRFKIHWPQRTWEDKSPALISIFFLGVCSPIDFPMQFTLQRKSRQKFSDHRGISMSLSFFHMTREKRDSNER